MSNLNIMQITTFLKYKDEAILGLSEQNKCYTIKLYYRHIFFYYLKSIILK